MKQKYIGNIFIILIGILLILPTTVLAVNKKYAIESYNIDFVVKENNVFDITETITAFFNVPQHGIYRKIPLRNTVTRTDGTTSHNRAEISNISVSEEYTTYNEDGYKIIKIGRADSLEEGSKTYTIKYSYNIGKDPVKDSDEFYFNLIGDEWDTDINNITFNIIMPKSFDKSLLGFSSGVKGSTDSSRVTYAVNGNEITGKFAGTLYMGHALTVRLELPDGYFVNASNNVDIIMLLSIILPFIFVIITAFFWYKFGKDEPVIETVEFYPPEGFNSAEIGFLYRGKANAKDVVSLLIYLANKGYLKITEYEKKVLFIKSKDFKIIKLKEYDGRNESERIFLEDLFDNRDEVTSEDLNNEFYVTLERILKEINTKENKNKIFEMTSSKKIKWVIGMILIALLSIIVNPVLEYEGVGLFIAIVPFLGFGLFIFLGTVFDEAPWSMKKLSYAICGLAFGLLPLCLIVLPIIKNEEAYMLVAGVGLVCMLAMALFLIIMLKRTSYGNEMLGKIKGFKSFLENAEKEKLEALVMQDPTYFYNILPYTYVLGVSDKWISQFETIAIQEPSWYVGDGPFSMHAFGSFMHSTMTSASDAMSSSPSGGGGGSSGGGSSGGGSGGGGGGSW